MTTNKDMQFANWLTAWRLPTQFQRYGLILAFCSLVLMIIAKYQFPEERSIRIILKYALIVFLFLASLAQEQHEDERSVALRMRSYQVAFLMTICYAILMPFVEVAVDTVFFNDPGFKEIGVASILGFMLMIQMGYYSLFKRLG